jgi:hypothetical protein
MNFWLPLNILHKCVTNCNLYFISNFSKT